ncbi:MAG: FG-GAP repeat protein [Planctomycetes bacterium]|nr:FG-GAP repeat protein [Planctomycetota bacterium]
MLRTTSFGRLGAPKELGAGRVEHDGERALLVRDELVEWFEPRSHGLEHGWTIAAPPAGERTSALWIGLEFTGLHPQLAEDGKSAALVDERAQHRLYYRGLLAVDATGKELEARLCVRAAGVGIQFDDEHARYPIVVDPILSTIAWAFEVDQAGADLGQASTAGDVNGDGYSDLLVAARWYDGINGADAGVAWCFHGSASGLSLTPSWVSFGPVQAGAWFGSSLCALGDINGDRFDDVAIAAPLYSGPESEEGVVYVYLGSAGGLQSTPHWVIEGNTPNAHFGGDLEHVGDVNGDGLSDLAVCTSASGVAGFARVYAGTSNPSPGAPLWSMTAAGLAAFGVLPTHFDYLGNSPHVGGAGDVDGDGYDDLLLGCGFYELNGVPGRAFLFRGGPSGPSTVPVWSATGPVSEASFGLMPRSAGDLNGDGLSDVIIGDPHYSDGSSGAVLVYISNPQALPTLLPTSPSQILTSPSAGAFFGGSRGSMSCGDVDGDAIPDVIVGGWRNAGQSGRAWLFKGSAVSPWLSPTPDSSISSGQSNGLLGFFAGTAGDVNGDGRSDAYVTHLRFDNPELDEGTLYVFYGQPQETPLHVPLAIQTSSLTGTTGSSFATALTTAGDANGDGFSDLLVGSPGFQGAFANEGRVALYRAKSDGTGLENASIWSFSGGQTDARLGTSVTFAGDVNNDGFTDVLVGAPGFATDLTQFQEGKAFLFLGTSSGVLSGTPSWTFEGDAINAKFGQALAGAGDVNGDGYADVFVGAPGATVGGLQDSGRVYVFLGSPTGLGATPALVLDNPVTGDARFGASLANAGDLNRDGQTDLVVGAPDYSNPESEEGRVYVFLGSAAGVVPTPAFTVESDLVGAHLGTAVSGAGDVDADGYADILVGAPDTLGGGRVTLYRGQLGLAPIAPGAQVFNGTQGGARLGAALCRAGDVNNDGFSDVAFSAPNFNLNQGEVYVHLGVSSGLATSPTLTFPGSAGANLGAGMGPCGDIDGDGFSDVVLGQPGQLSGTGGLLVYVGGTQYGGVRRTQQRRVTAANAYDRLALQTESVGQMRLSGGPNTFANLASTPAGREHVALEWEMKGGAALLNGTGLEIGPFQDCGSPTAPLRLDVVDSTGISAGQRYQWRQRIATKNPFFPHGLWVALQGDGRHEKKFGTGIDCDSNGVPDTTEIAQNPGLDCDANGQLDSCQIALDPTRDCDNDGSLNSCELLANDCDGDGCPDDCERLGLITGCGSGSDCNSNNVLDNCDITANPGLDGNGDGILDTCQFVPYCFGDGTGTVCPCGNNGGAGRGCANSVNANGAVLTVTGWPSIASDTLVLHGAGMPNSVSPSAIYLQGTAQDNGGLGTPIQDGLRCVTGSLIRLGTRPNSGNQSQYPDVGNVIVSIRGGLAALPMPQTRYYQVFYRNAATAFCPPGTANWTNAVAVTWGP